MGTFQNDATKLSNDPMETSGMTNQEDISKHSHKTYVFSGEYRRKGVKWNYPKDLRNQLTVVPYSKTDVIGAYLSKGYKNMMDKSGEHNHNVKTIVDNGGDIETRPKNISLYTYIKIN